MDGVKTVAAIFAVLLIVVIVHELGHYLVAKRSGIKVEEFAVGFGPRVLSKRVGETVYALRLLPAGGFVRLAGMTGLEEEDPGPRAFWRASVSRRIATLVAGGAFNLVFAGIVFSFLVIGGQSSVVPSFSPLHAAGLSSGDRIVSVDGRAINYDDQASVTKDLHAVTDGSEGHPVTLSYTTASGASGTTTAAPYLQLFNLNRSNSLPSGMVVDTINGSPVTPGDPTALFHDGAAVTVTGHAPGDTSKKYSGTVANVTAGAGAGIGDIGRIEAGWRFGFSPGWNGNSFPFALGRGFTRVPTAIADTFTGLYQILTTPNSGGVSGNLQGPVGIIRDTGSAAGLGWLALVEWIGILSVNLGLFNLLPIPFLDGGRVVFVVLEAIRRRRVDPRREAAFHLAGLMLILTLAVYVTLTGDIGRGTT
jgi:regulator of sigma E protease